MWRAAQRGGHQGQRELKHHSKAFCFLCSDVLHLVIRVAPPWILWCALVRGGLSLGKKGSPLYKRKMAQWAKLVRPTITRVPKSVLQGIYKGIPRKTMRIIAANGGAISG